MSLTDLIEQAKTLAESLCEDTCSIVEVSSANDGYGGQTETRATLVSDVPCIYEAVNDQVLDASGQRISIISHKLYLMTDSDTQAIKPHYEIVVDAKGDKDELTFENPQRMSESYEALLTVGAKLRL